MGADGEQIVLAPRGADEAGGLVLVFGDEPAVGADLDVAAGFGAAVVAGRAVGVEADESREAPRAAIHLVDDLLVIDPLEQLPGDADARRRALLPELIEEAVGDELQALLDQLVVDLPLLLDLIGSLKLGRQPGLELAKPDIVEARRVDMITGEPAARAAADLDRPVDGPVGVLRVVDGGEDLPIHCCPPLRPSIVGPHEGLLLRGYGGLATAPGSTGAMIGRWSWGCQGTI